MGQRAAAQTPQTQHHQFATGNAAMRGGEFTLRRFHRDFQRGFGGARERGGDFQRIVRHADQLRAQRKSCFAGHDADPVERAFVIVAAFGSRHCRDQRIATARQFERAAIDQRAEQIGPPPQFVGQRRRQSEAIGEQAEQAGPRFEQAEQIDRARHQLEQLLPPRRRLVGIVRCGERFDQRGPDRLEPLDRCGAAKRGKAPVLPLRHTPHQGFVRRSGTFALAVKMQRGGRDRYAIFVEQRVEALRHRCRQSAYMRDQRRAVRQPVEPRDCIELVALGQRVCLLILDHLEPVLDPAQAAIACRQRSGIVAADAPGFRQRIERHHRPPRPQRRIAPAMDQLMRLRIEFDFANPAAPQFEIVSRLGLRRPGLHFADPMGELAHGIDRSEIEAAAPDEGADMVEKRFARRDVARAGARTNICRPFPGERAAFVMRDRRFQRDRQRADFGCGTQTQIDAENVTLGGVVGQ